MVSASEDDRRGRPIKRNMNEHQMVMDQEQNSSKRRTDAVKEILKRNNMTELEDLGKQLTMQDKREWRERLAGQKGESSVTGNQSKK